MPLATRKKMNLRLALWLLMDYFILVGINVEEGKCLNIKIAKRLCMSQIIIISNYQFHLLLLHCPPLSKCIRHKNMAKLN